jgi:serpin B
MRRLTLRLLPSSSIALLLLGACPSAPSSGSDAKAPAKTAPKVAEPKTPDRKAPEAPTPAPTQDPSVTPKPPVPTPAPAPTPATAATPEVVAEVAAGFNAFGLELYRKVATAPGDQVISPASVAMALAMTHAGARGDTAKEMEAALHVTRPVGELQAAVGTMLASWNETREPSGGEEAPAERMELAVANRLFGEATVPYEPAFLELSRSVFAAPLEPVDFKGAHEAARTKINDWVEDRTHDRIQELLPGGAVDASTRLVLVNAIYFKSQWMAPFPDHLTKPAPFFAGKRSHDVPTMNVTEHFSFTESTADGVQVIELRYRDSGFSMLLVVPLAKDGLPAVEAALTNERLTAWTGALVGERISLSLPKFRIAPDEGLRLSQALGELGIRKAFSAEADFTGIAPASEQIQLAEAYHKGFIAVDEKGTEAAAATAMAARAGGMPSEPRAVKVDRPFLYFVRDTSSGLVMFMGRVVDPKTE